MGSVKSPTDSERIAPRHVFERWIWIYRGAGGKQSGLRAWTRDLSETGLAAFSAQTLMPGESVLLEIDLSIGKTIKIPALVARTLGTEYGFQFTALSSEQRDAIRLSLQQAPAVSDPKDRQNQ